MKMTIEQMRVAINKNIEEVVTIGRTKMEKGISEELLQMRCHSFKDVIKWKDLGGCHRKKDAMTQLFKRSEHMVKVFNRL